MVLLPLSASVVAYLQVEPRVRSNTLWAKTDGTGECLLLAYKTVMLVSLA